MWELMSMENWWNERSMGEPKYLETNLSQCHFVPHGLAWDQAQIMWWEAGDWPPEPWHSQPVTDRMSHGTAPRLLKKFMGAVEQLRNAQLHVKYYYDTHGHQNIKKRFCRCNL